MKELFMERLTNLMTVKSIATIIMTFVFAYMSLTGMITGEQFLTMFSIVITFYFSSQANKDK